MRYLGILLVFVLLISLVSGVPPTKEENEKAIKKYFSRPQSNLTSSDTSRELGALSSETKTRLVIWTLVSMILVFFLFLYLWDRFIFGGAERL